MSLQTLNELTTTALIPADKNVRILVTGLAICDNLNSNTPEIEFLRHVPNHELLMNVVQKKRSDSTYKKAITVKIEKEQNVEILGAEANTTPNQLADLLGIQTIHGQPIVRRPNSDPNVKALTKLKLKNCNFFTAKLTNESYKFDDTEGSIIADKPYCEILGGDMKFTNQFTISLDNGIPLTFQVTNDVYYEVSFVNSCDNTPGCKDEEDFKYMYDIVKENKNPFRKFKMKQMPRATGTGACLPACTKC